MKLVALALLAASVVADGSEAPVVSHKHATKVPPMPAAYAIWRPDPNEMKDVLSGKKSLIQHKHHKCKGKKDCKETDDDDDDFDFQLPANFGVGKAPSYGGFKMDESSTILYEMLGQIANPKFIQFAEDNAKKHNLMDAKKAGVVVSMKQNLESLQKGGHDYMLEAAQANNPSIPAKKQREIFAEMLETMIKHATTVTPAPVASKFSHTMEKFEKENKLHHLRK